VLRFDKKGEIQAFAAGAEDRKKGRCDRQRRGDIDYDDDDDEEEGEVYKWVKESLHELKPMFFERVDYQLHVQGKRRCTGGGACRFWQDDMEW